MDIHSDILQRYMPAFEDGNMPGFEHDKQIYGTAMNLNRDARSEIYTRFIPGFKDGRIDPMTNNYDNVNLGSPDHKCLYFLKEHLR